MMWRRATVVVLLLIGLLVALGGQPVDGRKRKRPDRRSHSQYFYGAPTTGKCGYDVRSMICINVNVITKLSKRITILPGYIY